MTSAIDAAVEALSGVGTGNLTVTKVAGVQAYTLEFGGDRANAPIGALTIQPTGFTPRRRGHAGEWVWQW